MKISPLHYGLIAFILGVGVADIVREYWVLNGVFIFLGFLLWKKISPVQALLYSGLFLLGCIRLFFALPQDEAEKGVLFSLAKTQEKIFVIGTIESLPEQSPQKISFYLDAHAWQKIPQKGTTPEEWQKIDEKIFVSLYGIHTFTYGQKVQIQGKIDIPKNSEDFSYARFLEREGVYAYFPSGRGKVLDPDTSISFWNESWQKIFSVRDEFEKNIREKIPSPESEYALGIILGAEKGIPKKIIEEFNDTGLRHLLALSGFNITLLLLFVFWVFSVVPRKGRIVIALLVIAFFVGITGASSSVVRAAIMGGLGLMILHEGRDNDILALIGATLFILLLWNPLLLIADPGLQLSVLAVLGLFWYVPVVEKFFPLPKKFPLPLKQALWATIAAQIFTLPVMLFYFHQFSLISPLANIVVAPLTTFSMVFSSLVVIPYIGIVFIPLAYIFLHFSLTFTHLLSQVPFAILTVPSFSPWIVAVLYIPLVWFGVKKMKKS